MISSACQNLYLHSGTRFLRGIRHLLGIRKILTGWRWQIDAFSRIRRLGFRIRISGGIRDAIHLYLLQNRWLQIHSSQVINRKRNRAGDWVRRAVSPAGGEDDARGPGLVTLL